MKNFVLLLCRLVLSMAGVGQYVYTIKADSVKLTDANFDTTELIILNHSQTVPGSLLNKGLGRAAFQKALQKIKDTTYFIDADTLTIHQVRKRSLYNSQMNVLYRPHTLGQIIWFVKLDRLQKRD